MEKIITKRNVMFISGVLLGFSLLGQYLLSVSGGQYLHTYVSLYKAVMYFSVAVLVFSIALSFLQEEVFRFWVHFVCYWAPLHLIVVLFFILNEKDVLFNPAYGLFSDTVSMFLTTMFTIVSVILTLLSLSKLPKSQKTNIFLEKGRQWISKRRLFIFGLPSTLVFAFLFQRSTSYAVYESLGPSYVNLLNIVLFTLLPCATVFVASLFIRKYVFEFWKTSAFVYVFAYLYVVIAVPSYLGDEFLHIEKDIIALAVSVLYLATSFIFGIFHIYRKQEES